MKTPTYDELEDFFRYDRWTVVRSTDHVMYEKVLPDGEILSSHRSMSGKKTMSPGRFKSILSAQLRVSEAEFWEVLRTRKPAPRPSAAVQSRPATLPYWLVSALVSAGISEDEVAGLDEASARALLDDLRSRPT